MVNKKKLDSKTAYRLLTEDIIKEENDLKQDKNRWVLHCLYSGMAAGRIAEKLGLDSDYAASLGYVHDIGRRISHPKHIIEGYNYLKALGYNNEARICLTHSFIYNDITLAAGPFPSNKAYQAITEHLNEEECNTYDNIIQLCDLFCLETGFTTLEKRILDISIRKGVFPCSKRHFNKAIELKEELEDKMGCNLYELFPEISQVDLENRQNHLVQLEKLFTSINFTPLNIGISKDSKLPKENAEYYLNKLSRDNHNVFFIAEEELLSIIKNKKIDIMYSSNDNNWGELIEIGVPCFLIESQDQAESSLPKVSDWESIYQQVSAIASNKKSPESSNSTKLVKK